MAAPKLSRKLAQEALDAHELYKTELQGAAALKIGRSCFEHRVRTAKEYGLKPKTVKKKLGHGAYDSRQLDPKLAQQALDAYTRNGGNAYAAARSLGVAEPTIGHRLQAAKRLKLEPTVRTEAKAVDMERLTVVVLGILKRQPHTVTELADRLKVSEALAQRAAILLAERGHNIFTDSIGRMSVERTPAPPVKSNVHEYVSDDNGRYRFGVVSDTHLCSKYCREDVLADLYDWFKAEGISRVYHAGNWVDGEARFNKFDLTVHGMDAQCRYVVEHYPQREGIATYVVSGDDHCGWWNQREGVDIGRYIERMMRDAGRKDWFNLGYMEAFISLKHKRSEKSSQMLVMHPGGGSAYAVSYQPQKIVESLAGGEKPAVMLVGHYHKMELLSIRNTWVLQAGCTKDQDPFLRKKRIEVHIGGTIMELRQDEKGAITDCITWMKRYFNTGYYQDRWSHSGDVVLPRLHSKTADGK